MATDFRNPHSHNFPTLDPTKQKFFENPVPPVPPRTFELGLVLGGTVSAGAYTAGALDSLIEALDAFQNMVPGGPPPHQVVLKLAAGSSGGAVCSALLGVHMTHAFPHVPEDPALRAQQQAQLQDNKFWDIWVNRFDFSQLMDTGDLGKMPDEDQSVPALLNGRMIDTALQSIVTFAGSPANTNRKWADSPFSVATTVCNLRGIPYKVAGVPTYGGYTGNSYIEHDDFAWFQLPNGAGTGRARPDAFVVTGPSSSGWATLADFARASGAMPVGLPARSLSRPAEHYLYRPFPRTDSTGMRILAWPTPDWPELDDVAQGGPYAFTAVDGGTLNNDPVKIAHQALSGPFGVNPRMPDVANRALFMIDPLVDEPDKLDGVGLSLVSVAKALIGNFVGGARYLTADIELFEAGDVFSRFQLVPTRQSGKLTGEAALAGTDLFALGGWCHRSFREHDYLLGRHNMQQYLMTEFILQANNAVFDGWTDTQRADYALDGNGHRIAVTAATPHKDYFLPVIPLTPQVAIFKEPQWPFEALDRPALVSMVKERAEKVLSGLREDNLKGFWGWLIGTVTIGSIANDIASNLVDGFLAALKKRNLGP